MSTGPHTVWLASYPKSGNTWTRAVLAALTGEEARSEIDINQLDGGPIAGARWPLDSCLGFATSDLLPDEIDALRPACDAAFDAELTGTRFRKIHDALFSGPDEAPIVPPAATRAAVYLIRDPRDVAVSFAHFLGRTGDRTVRLMADPDGALGVSARALRWQARQRLDTWSGHVRSWTTHDLFPVAVFRYEDLLVDPVGEFGRMARFAGLTATRDEVAAAVAAAGFERLREQERRHGFHERPSSATAFFRRGIAGAWRDELPAFLAERVVADHAEMMARYGYGPEEVLPLGSAALAEPAQ